jgi:hypothetical protein
VISDRDVWAAALLIVKRYRDDVMLEATTAAGAGSRQLAGDAALPLLLPDKSQDLWENTPLAKLM